MIPSGSHMPQQHLQGRGRDSSDPSNCAKLKVSCTSNALLITSMALSLKCVALGTAC